MRSVSLWFHEYSPKRLESLISIFEFDYFAKNKFRLRIKEYRRARLPSEIALNENASGQRFMFASTERACKKYKIVTLSITIYPLFLRGHIAKYRYVIEQRSSVAPNFPFYICAEPFNLYDGVEASIETRMLLLV